jgi:dihydroorotase
MDREFTNFVIRMSSILILNANIVNENKVFQGDVLIKGERIEKIGKGLQSLKGR